MIQGLEQASGNGAWSGNGRASQDGLTDPAAGIFHVTFTALMTKSNDARTSQDALTAGVIQVAAEKLFGGGRGVQTFARSGLRYLSLPGGAILVEQNPKKKSKWALLATSGHNVAWALRDGKYLARVVDGEVLMLK